ncbi:hypothetical protein B0T09DRAFT_333695 [Sordaria sp. MPI-SDFR-AT-0083]|nr:hypothetical protein B0T09DRAFT_333695 [Sordaria sp. MPI-SDFR-AT-0083]
MAPSMLKLGAVALAYTFGVSALSSPASGKTYQLSESYNSGNFAEKFSFFEGGREEKVRDPNNGYVKYLGKDAAVSSGLIKTEGDDIRIGVDSKTSGAPRKSVRLESTASYNTGLFVAKFSHFPKPVCGAWPAFWMVGDNWPQDGEVDIYEMWSLADHNRITYHTGTPAQVGECKLVDETHVETTETWNCDNYATGQWVNEGCGVTEKQGQWGSPSGGVYAIEWTEDHLSVWSWATEPTDIENGTPNPETWGRPHMSVTSKTCDVEKAFKNLRFILNINFCGDAAGQLFGLDPKCGSKGSSCDAYVSNNPSDFDDVYWKIKYIDVYQLQKGLPTTTSSAISSSTTSSAIVSSTETSTATASSSTVTSSFVSVVSSSAASTSEVISTSAVSTEAVSSSVVSSSAIISSSAVSSSEVISSSAVVSASAVPSSEVVSNTDVFSNIASASGVASSSDAVFVTATSSATLPTETDDDSDCDDDDEGDVSSGIVVPSGSATVSIVPGGSAIPSDIVIPSGSVVPSASVIETGSSSIITSAPSGPSAGFPVISSSGVVSDFPISSAPADPSASGGFPVPSGISTGPVLFPNSTITASQEWTTSTIYTTSYYTVTSCAATVTDCPARVVTSVIAISTTVCPVTQHPAAPTNAPGGGNGVPVVPTQVPGGCNGVNCPVPTQIPSGPNDGGNGTPGNGTPGNGTPGNGTPGNGTPGNGTPGNGTPGNGNGNGEGVPPVVPTGSAPGTGSGVCNGENCPVPTGSAPGSGSGSGEGEVPAVPTGSAPGTGSGNNNGSVPPVVPGPIPTGTLPGNSNGTYSVPPVSGTGVAQPPAPIGGGSSPSVSIGQPPIPTEDVPVTAGAGKNALSVGVAVVAGIAALLAL